MNDDMLQTNATRRSTGSRLTCSQCERMLLDAADESLLPEDQAQFDLHLAGCDSCSRLMADAQRGRAWLGMLHAAPPEPSGDLVRNILARTSGDPTVAIPLRPRNEPILSYAGSGGYALGADDAVRAVAFGPVQTVSWLRRFVAAVSQPRFAMTTAMAFFSIALTLNLTGVSLRNLHASSFTPSNLRHSFWATNARVFRYYDNLRVVYELESRVHEVQRDTDDNSPAALPAPQPTVEAPAKAPSKSPSPKSEGSHSGLTGQHESRPRATVDVPSHSVIGTLSPGSLTASAATNGGEGASA